MNPLRGHVGHVVDGATLSFLTPDLLTLAVIGTMSALYVRAGRTLRSRNRRIPAAQQIAWWSGIVCMFLGTQTVLDPIGETTLVSAHMLQHLLIADIAGMLLIMGARAPVGMFIWPRPIMTAVVRTRMINRVWGVLTRPALAVALWLLVLYVWHWPAMYEGALTHPLMHDLQHLSFIGAGIVSWWPVLEPTRRTVPAPLWKAFYLGVERGLGTAVLGAFFIFAPFQLYGFYGDRSLHFGIDPLLDQQIAGAIMLAVDLSMVFGGFLFFLLRSAAEGYDDAPGPRQRDRLAAREAHVCEPLSSGR